MIYLINVYRHLRLVLTRTGLLLLDASHLESRVRRQEGRVPDLEGLLFRDELLALAWGKIGNYR